MRDPRMIFRAGTGKSVVFRALINTSVRRGDSDVARYEFVGNWLSEASFTYDHQQGEPLLTEDTEIPF